MNFIGDTLAASNTVKFNLKTGIFKNFWPLSLPSSF